MADNYTVYLYPYTLTASSHSDLYTGDVFPHAVLHDPSIPGRFLMQLPLEMAEASPAAFRSPLRRTIRCIATCGRTWTGR